MVGCAVVFPVASSVGVARSPRAGVPSPPCLVSGGWGRVPVISVWGPIRASAACVGGVRPRGSCGVRWGWGALVPPSWYALLAGGSWCPPRCPLSLRPGPCSLPFPALGWFPAPTLCRSRCPVPMGACLSPWALPCPLAGVSLSAPCPALARALSLPGVVVVGLGGGAAGPGLGVGGLEPLAEGSGAVGGAEALDRVPEEGLPCRLRHDGLRGGLVGVGRGAGADLLEGVHHVHPFSSSRSPGPLQPTAELLQSGGRPPGEVGGGLGGGRVRARGPGVAGGGRGPVVVAGVEAPWGSESGGGGAGAGGRVQATGGAGGPVGPVGGGGGGHWAAVVCLAAPGGAGAAVAGTGGGGRVRAEGGTGSPVGPVGGGGSGHGAAVAQVVAPGGAGAAGAGPWGVVVAPWGAGAARVSG